MHWPVFVCIDKVLGEISLKKSTSPKIVSWWTKTAHGIYISNLAYLLVIGYYELRTKEKLYFSQNVNSKAIIDFPHRRYQQCSICTSSGRRKKFKFSLVLFKSLDRMYMGHIVLEGYSFRNLSLFFLVWTLSTPLSTKL